VAPVEVVIDENSGQITLRDVDGFKLDLGETGFGPERLSLVVIHRSGTPTDHRNQKQNRQDETVQERVPHGTSTSPGGIFLLFSQVTDTLIIFPRIPHVKCNFRLDLVGVLERQDPAYWNG
jgi:hypothetical protein